VATLLGMAIAIQPIVAVCCLAVFFLVLLLTRFVSLSSILAGICFMVCILFIFNEKEPLYRIFAVLVALMVVITHQKNISRLIKGTESKIPLNRRKNRRSLD
jgi:glycerol-3-phosphate acyltransferase PlsY